MNAEAKKLNSWQMVYAGITPLVVGREMEIKSILAAMAAGKHVLLEGPPGTSKSTLLRLIARETGVPFFMIEGNIDLTPAKLVGYFNPAKVLADSYRPEHFEKGPLTRAMQEGGLLYIEEFNRMPADVANVLISPMEEREMSVPRYGTVRAVCPFTVIAAQNPYDDVGTVRVSRAFMDRICRIEMEYQSEAEEQRILSLRTGVQTPDILAAAIALVRATRDDPDIKLGASIRAAIDLVDLFVAMEDVQPNADENFMAAAQMAIANKIWLNEMAEKTAVEIIREIISRLKLIRILSKLNLASTASIGSCPLPPAKPADEEAEALKKKAVL